MFLLFCYPKNSSYLCTRLGAGNKQANRKIMADIEKSHHSQDLARVRTESFKTLLDDIRHIIEKRLQEAYFIGSQI